MLDKKLEDVIDSRLTKYISSTVTPLRPASARGAFGAWTALADVVGLARLGQEGSFLS